MPVSRKVHGLKPDPVDPRDFRYKRDRLKAGWLRQKFMMARLPQTVDLREEANPPVWDQGQLGSCTAQASAAVLGHVTADQGDGVRVFSRLFIYGNGRGWSTEDEGATLRDVMKGLDKYGVPLESMWPYDLAKWQEKPPREVWDAAYHREAIDYYRLDGIDDMRLCLGRERKPFLFGVLLYSSFEATPENGFTVPMPQSGDRVSGGHAMACLGYDHPNRRFLVRNSWSADWGMGGYCWMPYDYFENSGLFWDGWTVRSIPA